MMLSTLFFRQKHTRVAAALGAGVLALLLAGCTPGDAVPAPAPIASTATASSAPDASGISVAIEVPETTLAPGADETVTVIVTNASGRPVDVGCGLSVTVGVTTFGKTFHPGALADLCIAVPPKYLAVGATSYQIDVRAAASTCVPDAQSVTDRCVGSGRAMPPLPVGSYWVEANAFGPGPDPNGIDSPPVTLHVS